MEKNGQPRAARWAVAAAWAVPVCVLLSAVWRVGAVLDGAGPAAYLIFLSVLSMALALLTPVLVRRRTPDRRVTWIAVAGASSVVLLCAYALLNPVFGFVEPGGAGQDRPGWEILRWYVPLLAWGPLVLAVAAERHRRTARDRQPAGQYSGGDAGGQK